MEQGTVSERGRILGQGGIGFDRLVGNLGKLVVEELVAGVVVMAYGYGYGWGRNGGLRGIRLRGYLFAVPLTLILS